VPGHREQGMRDDREQERDDEAGWSARHWDALDRSA
jgi:hypothetical protein